MRDDVLILLKTLGIADADEDPLLDIVIASCEWRVKNLANLAEIPAGLKSLTEEMIVGEYLRTKKNAGTLEGFDLAAAVKSLQEGDTNVSFAVGEGSSTPEQRLDALIDRLVNGRLAEIYRYRRLVW